MPGSAGEMSPFSFSEDSLRFRHKTTHSFLFGNRIFTFLEIFTHFLFKEDIFLDTIPKFLFLIFFFQPFLLLNVSFKEEAVSCFRGKHPKHLDSHHKKTFTFHSFCSLSPRFSRILASDMDRQNGLIPCKSLSSSPFHHQHRHHP